MLKVLNDKWPCTTSTPSGKNNHVVKNLCSSGAPSEHWPDYLLRIQNGETNFKAEYDHIYNADIFLIETAVNDELGTESYKMNKWNISPIDYIKKQTELITHMISNLPNKPSIIYVGASTRLQSGLWYDIRNTRTTDSVYIHKELTTYYNLPYLS